MDKWIIAFFVFLTFSCQKNSMATDPSIMQFDVTKKYAPKKFDIHDIAEVDYILPMTQDSFLFTNFVYLSERFILMFNYFEGDFVFFDRKGNPVSRISKMGNGPTEYLPYYWLQVYCDEEDELFLFSVPNVLKVYDRCGNYKRTLPLRNKEKIDCSIDGIYTYNKDYLLCHDKLSDSNPFYLLSKRDGSTKDIPIYKENKFDGRLMRDYGNGNTINVFLDTSYAIKDGENILLTEYASDTIFAYTPDSRLIPEFIRTPAISRMNPPIVVHGFLKSGSYSFFSTQKKEYDFQTKKGMEHKGYVYDRSTAVFYEVKVLNSDYKDQELVITPAEMTSRIGESSSDPYTGVRVLYKNDLEKDDKMGKLSGELKRTFDRMKEDDLFILMIINLKI